MSCDICVINASLYQRLQAGRDPALRSERLASAQTVMNSNGEDTWKMVRRVYYLVTIIITVVNDRSYGADKRPTLIMTLQTCSRQRSCCQLHSHVSPAVTTHCFQRITVPSIGSMHCPTDELPYLVALVLSVHGDTLVDCDRARDRKHAFHWPQRSRPSPGTRAPKPREEITRGVVK
jgi:hypothetical protein